MMRSFANLPFLCHQHRWSRLSLKISDFDGQTPYIKPGQRCPPTSLLEFTVMGGPEKGRFEYSWPGGQFPVQSPLFHCNNKLYLSKMSYRR